MLPVRDKGTDLDPARAQAIPPAGRQGLGADMVVNHPTLDPSPGGTKQLFRKRTSDLVVVNDKKLNPHRLARTIDFAENRIESHLSIDQESNVISGCRRQSGQILCDAGPVEAKPTKCRTVAIEMAYGRP